MAKFSKFEEIQAWQKAYEVNLLIYRISGQGDFGKDFGLKDQFRQMTFPFRNFLQLRNYFQL